MTTTSSAVALTAAGVPGVAGALGEIERRVLWLSTAIIHHANRVRLPGSGLKVGGHQASSASIFLAAIHRVPLAALGVTSFGQSGDIDDVYRYHGIDADSIVAAAHGLAG